jgi:hypothetical protein
LRCRWCSLCRPLEDAWDINDADVLLLGSSHLDTEEDLNPNKHHDACYQEPYQPNLHTTDQEDPDSRYMHTPQPPSQPIKRWRTVREVQLFEGNLVLDVLSSRGTFKETIAPISKC